MPSWRKFAGGKTLTAKSLGSRVIRGKVTDVTVEKLKARDGSEQEKICLAVEDERKIIPMNVTNCENLANVYGEDFDDWIGKPIEVSVHETTFANKPVDGLLVLPLKLKRGK